MSCNCSCNSSDLSLLNETLDHYASVPGSLITILQKAQAIYGFLPSDVLNHISLATGIPAAKVFGVATFYTQFRFKPVGKYLIMLCQGTACHVNGSLMLEKTIFDTLGIKDGETTEDGLFTLKNVACLGCCSLSPVMMINDETYGSLTPQKVRDILARLKDEALKEADEQ
ncbi:MAG: NADH-quinone oxidoreductase subunit NuoE [Clostridia bacterium]|nr:NADH-quinone oxidoreductase subunit NuoE [Clostridia bacterium]